MGVRTRLRQGLRDVFAFTQTVSHAEVRSHLTAAQYSLFVRMTHAEQLHSRNVLRDVLAQSAETPNDLAVAALLHDVGKSRYALNVLQRSLVVVVKRLTPAVETRLSKPTGLHSWRAPFVVRRHHPRWSAEMLRACGSSPRAIWLVEHHDEAPARWQEHEWVGLLERLRRADDAN